MSATKERPKAKKARKNKENNSDSDEYLYSLAEPKVRFPTAMKSITNTHCGKFAERSQAMFRDLEDIFRVGGTDHHEPPSERSIKFYKNTLEDVNAPTDSGKYGIEVTESQIHDQIYMFDKLRKPVCTINSMYLDFRRHPYFGIEIYKRTGTTAGQMIHMDLYEVEQLIVLFANRLIPDIYTAAQKSWDFIMKELVSFSAKGELTFEPKDFTLLGVPRDALVVNPDIPDEKMVYEKIKVQISKNYYYEQGKYKIQSISVLVNVTSKRWLIGLYKIEGERKGQAIWFSIYEAQWLVDSLMTMYERGINFLKEMKEIKELKRSACMPTNESS